jgi:hypothetical protein
VVAEVSELYESVTAPHHKKLASYEMLPRASDLDGFFGTTKAKESGYEIITGV